MDPNIYSSTLGLPIWAFIIVVVWSLIWKGLALWKSARLNQPVWFIVLLVVNTIGILEILYLFLFSKLKFENIEQINKKGLMANKRAKVRRTVRKKR